MIATPMFAQLSLSTPLLHLSSGQKQTWQFITGSAAGGGEGDGQWRSRARAGNESGDPLSSQQFPPLTRLCNAAENNSSFMEKLARRPLVRAVNIGGVWTV